MASQPDSGSRLWRGLRSLMFGEDSEPSLRDQIEEAIDEAEEDQPKKGDLSPLERQMLKNLLHFGDRTAGDICVTRGEIISAPHGSSMEELAKAFAEAGHSRLPITGDSLDEIIGMVHIKDVFNAYFDATERKSVDEIMRTPLFVPESMGILDLLVRMRAERIHLAVVIDEFGGTEGLVTIEDVVEEIVGDIADEHDEEEQPLLVRLDDGLWDADARLELDDLAEAVDPRLIAEDDEVDTLGGLAFLLAGRILEPGESIAHPSGWRLESLEADERKMLRLRLHAPEGAEREDA
ncbi:hemolysin family protein [Sphingomonas rosea]|uniref:Hemolysin family protein n=1 Tax=Sphingomonas rosea TaxID=335605 RepID=A0ABP7U7Q1_9SPHN